MRFLALFVFAFLTACAPPTFKVTDYGTPEEWAPYKAGGQGVLEGQAFLRQQGGGVVTCAGSEVVIFPATPSTRRIVARARSEGAMFDVSGAPSYTGGGQKSVCDAQGNFRFQGLAAGPWFVTTLVVWMVGYYQQGGWLLQEVNVSSSGISKAFLTEGALVR